MNRIENRVISISDENNKDSVGDFLDELLQQSVFSNEAQMHLLYVQKAFEILRFHTLESLLNQKTDVIITFQGQQYLKSYEIVKALAIYPIYELRYAINGNEHLRFLFFPLEYDGKLHYVFVKFFRKTRKPPVDETNQMRDLAYRMYRLVLQDPKQYLEGIE